MITPPQAKPVPGLRPAVVLGAMLLACTGAHGAAKKEDPCVAAVTYRKTLVTLDRYGEKTCRGQKTKTLIGALFIQAVRRDPKRCGISPADEKAFATQLGDDVAAMHKGCGS